MGQGRGGYNNNRGGPSNRGNFNNNDNFRRNDSYDGGRDMNMRGGGRNNYNGE